MCKCSKLELKPNGGIFNYVEVNCIVYSLTFYLSYINNTLDADVYFSRRSINFPWYRSVCVFFFLCFFAACQRLGRYAGVIFIRILFGNSVKFPTVTHRPFNVLMLEELDRKKIRYVKSCIRRVPEYVCSGGWVVLRFTIPMLVFAVDSIHTCGPYHYQTYKLIRNDERIRAMVTAWGTYMRPTQTDFDFNAKCVIRN